MRHKHCTAAHLPVHACTRDARARARRAYLPLFALSSVAFLCACHARLSTATCGFHFSAMQAIAHAVQSDSHNQCN